MDSFYKLEVCENGEEKSYIIPEEDCLGSGMEGFAYKHNNEVIKLYKIDCRKIRLSRNMCSKLTKLKTERIILPNVVLLDKEDNMIGYKTTYIEDLGVDSFYKLDSKSLSKELRLVEKDMELLSDNSVKIRDINSDNTIYHNGIYLIDSGSYSIGKQTPKHKDIAYRKNVGEIEEYLSKLIHIRAFEKYKDIEKVDLFMKDLKKRIYSNNSSFLKFLQCLECDNIDELIDIEMKKQIYSLLVDGKRVFLDKDYRRIYFGHEKDIYLHKKNNTKLVLYKNTKPEIKLTKEQLKKLASIETERIITPTGEVEVLNNNKIAYQIEPKFSFPKYAVDMSGKDVVEEFELLKKDADKLADNGIYIGSISMDDTLFSESLYVDSIELMEVSDNAKEKNIESLNRLVKSMITDILFDVTSPRNICLVLNSFNTNGFIGDAMKEELSSSDSFEECVRKMVKTRTK